MILMLYSLKLNVEAQTIKKVFFTYFDIQKWDKKNTNLVCTHIQIL